MVGQSGATKNRFTSNTLELCQNHPKTAALNGRYLQRAVFELPMMLAGTNAAGLNPDFNVKFGKLLKCYIYYYTRYYSSPYSLSL
jgi:hypothetical protein